MTTTLTVPETTPGIAPLPHVCWELIYRNTGQHVEAGDGTPHFDSEQDARTEADLIEGDADRDNDLGPIDVRKLDGPCFVATSACGYQLDADVMVMHHATAQDAEAAVKDCGWTLGPDGVLRCDDTCCAEGRI